MKILFIGDARNAKILLRAIDKSNDNEITHFATCSDAISELLSKKYDWAIVEGLTLVEHKKEIIHHIQRVNSGILDINAISKRENSNTEQSTKPIKCGVEWSKNGTLQLNCGLHNFVKHPSFSYPSALSDDNAILFEYHAPCKKDRRRDG